MKLERSREWWINRARQEPNVVIGAGPAPDITLDDGDPHYPDCEVAPPVTTIVETPPVPWVGLVRD